MKSQKSEVTGKGSRARGQGSNKNSELQTLSPQLLSGELSSKLNEKGFALVMVLLIAVIVLGVTTGLLYMITSETQMSGIDKRYKIAFAAIGETGIVSQLISARELAAIDLNLTTGINFQVSTALAACTINTTAALPDGTACNTLDTYTGLDAKLNLPSACWLSCDSTLPINPSAGIFDFSYDVGGYRTYAKIVDVGRGNTGGIEGLVKTGVVIGGEAGGGGGGSTQKIPYLYTIELEAQAITNPLERAKLSILYQY